MKRFLVIVFCLYLSELMAQQTPATLKTAIEEHLQKTEGVFAVAFKDLQHGNTLFIKEKELFHAASTMKTPVMIEVYKQAYEGKFDMNDSIIIKNDFKSIVDGSPYSLDVSDDSEDNLYGRIGKKSTVYDLTFSMITVSSNLATNILIDLTDARSVNATMRSFGAEDIQVLRGVEDNKAFRLGKNNVTTAYDLMIILEHIARGKAVNPEASEAMTNILLHQKFRDIIPASLPDNVRTAHKTGSITGVQHDSGIVMLPDGRKYILVLLSKNLKDKDAGIQALAGVSRMIYDSLK